MANKLMGDMQAELQILRSAYAAQLSEKIRQIEEAWIRLQSDWDREVLGALHRMVHSLTGSGATFGFVELSLVARSLEQLLKVLVGQEAAADSEQRSQVNDRLAELRRMAFQPDVQPQLPATVASAPAEPVIDKSRLIIVVDDEPVVSRALAMQLSYFGYQVREFNRLDEFCQAMKSIQDAIVLMDISFPEDGLGGVKAMKSVQQGRAIPIPVIFISALDNISARLESVRAGGIAYFTKPLNLGELIDKLDVLTSTQIPDAYRVLIIDDSDTLARFHSTVLEQAGMVVHVVNNPLEVTEVLSDFSPDLILMDIYMPECTGLELSKVIRQLEEFVSIPIVYLSAENDLNKQLSAMSLGGDDFLTKPIRPEHLVSSVSSRIQRSRLLRSFMVRDSLTGLLNHTAIKDHLVREVARAKREKKALSFAMIDIDHFKGVNDTYGHSAGDRVIKSLSRLLKQRLRENDVVGRYGGEEFAVILVDTDGEAAMNVLDGIRDAFSHFRHLAGSTEFFVTFSGGIADVANFDDAIKLGDSADKALYEAKNSGRNRLVMARG